MPARRTARWAVPGAAALVLSCAALVGCGSSGGSPSGGSPPTVIGAPSPGGSSPSAGNTSARHGKLTGNFCTDFKNIGSNLRIPAADSGSLTKLEQHDGKYLKQVVSYYNGLAAEAPPQVRQEIQAISSAYQRLASSITSGSTHSLTQIEQQVGALTRSGAAAQALKKLIIYVTTKCS